jgi:hypothetical protein
MEVHRVANVAMKVCGVVVTIALNYDDDMDSFHL